MTDPDPHPLGQSEGCHVATVLSEPLDKTLGFVGWYLDLGVRKIELFFDNPDDPAIPLLQKEDRVITHHCTPEFWRGLGVSPDRAFVKRQNAALTAAYRGAEAAWFLAVDADEFVYLGGRSLDDFANSLDRGLRAVRFTPAENVRTPGIPGRWFRLPVERRKVRDIYGDAAPFIARRGGLVGHADGKSMTRTGLKFQKVRQHWIVGEDGDPISDQTFGPADDAILLHLFDDGYDRWRAKLDWRAGAWGFTRSAAAHIQTLQDLPADQAEQAFQALYDLLHSVDRPTFEALQAVGGLMQLEIDPWASGAQYFAGRSPKDIAPRSAD